jgi:hypothetical protein
LHSNFFTRVGEKKRKRARSRRWRVALTFQKCSAHRRIVRGRRAALRRCGPDGPAATENGSVEVRTSPVWVPTAQSAIETQEAFQVSRTTRRSAGDASEVEGFVDLGDLPATRRGVGRGQHPAAVCIVRPAGDRHAGRRRGAGPAGQVDGAAVPFVHVAHRPGAYARVGGGEDGAFAAHCDAEGFARTRDADSPASSDPLLRAGLGAAGAGSRSRPWPRRSGPRLRP